MVFHPRIVIRSALAMSFLIVVACLALTRGITQVNAENSELPTSEATEVIDAQTAADGSDGTAEAQGPDTGAVAPACTLSRRFPDSVLRWCAWITQYAAQYELPPDLIAALIWYESGGNPDAISRSGAVGLMQVMPRDGLAASFQCINGPCFASRPTTAELLDPEYNIQYGTRLLASLYSRYQDMRLALRAYGPMDVGFGYADKLLAIYEQYRAE